MTSIFLIVVALLIPGICGQAIVIPAIYLDPNAACEVYNSTGDASTCGDVIPPGSLVYVNSTYPQALAEAIASALAAQISVVRIASTTCGDALYRYMCTSVFLPCENYDGGNASFALPVLPCQDLCTDANSLCSPFGVPAQPCPPNVTYDFTASGGPASYAPNCSIGWQNLVACPAACPFPEFLDVDSCCALHCPLAESYYGKKKWNALQYTHLTFCWMSCVLTTITVILYIVNPQLRRFPGWLVILCGVGMILASGALAMSSWWGVEGIQCPPDKTSHEAACWAQGILNVFGAHLATAYWLSLNVVTFAVVFSKNPRSTMDWLNEHQYLFAGFALIPVITTTASGHMSKVRAGRAFGPNGIFPWCSVFDFKSLYQGFTVPSLVLIMLGTLLWMASMTSIFVVWFRNRKTTKGNSLNLGMHSAIIAFELVCILTIGVLTFIFMGIYDHFYKVLPVQTLEYLSGIRAAKPDAKYSAVFVISFAVSIVGFLFAGIFGLRLSHLDFLKKKFSGVSGAISSMTTASRTTASGASGASGDKSSFGVYTISSAGDGGDL